jgi:pilus assembly protein CpaD
MMARLLRAVLAPALATLTLAACASGHDPAPPLAPIAALPTEQFPLRSNAYPDEIRLAPHAAGLSPEQRAALAELVGRWRDDGGGMLTIQSPFRGADARAAFETSRQAQALLLTLGAPAERVRVVGYEPPDAAPAAILVGFVAYEAVIPRCGTAWENLTATNKNTPMQNFGCAVSANMAAQIANPSDLQGPRASDPTDAGRRAVVIDKYRQGEGTSGAKDAGASGVVSKSSSGGGGG